MQRDDEAVSPVIATVLLLAITVLLTSMVFIMMSTTLDSTEKANPKISLSVRSLSNGYHVITVTSIDQPIDPLRVNWSINNISGQSSVDSQGLVEEIYGTVGTNVSFHDRDAGWSITKGDYFVINCENLDCGKGFHSFKLVHGSQDDRIVLKEIKIPASES
tara:strand:- start:342 stop:824 length:483 start_codon:yes stop_codon:yes gene_type:complete